MRGVKGRVQRAFPELGKIRGNPADLRPAVEMTPQNPSMMSEPLPSALAAVEQQIARACAEARRDRASVTLIAVSKTFGAETIAPVIEGGQRVFGENRVQEAKAKWPGLMSGYPGIALHLIGPLQSNKARKAVALFDAIHSVDRPSICQALAKEIDSQERQPQLFVQLNTGEEPQKAGVAPAEADAFIADFRPDVRSAGQPSAGAAFRADRQDSRAQRAEVSVDGHERRLRDSDPVRRHPCARRLGDFRGAVVAVPPGT